MDCRLYFKVVALITLFTITNTLAAQTGRPIYRDGGPITAYVDGKRCDVVVNLIFKAVTTDAYDRKTGNAAKIMGITADMLRASCAKSERFKVQGFYNEQMVYSGVAYKESKWKVLEQGPDTQGILEMISDSATKEDKVNFAQESNFLAADSFLNSLGTNNIECVEPKNNTCLVINEFRREDGEVLVVSQYLVDKEGTVATVESPTKTEGGFLFTNPKLSNISLKGAGQPDAAINDLRELLQDRLNSLGDRLYSGYKGTEQALQTQKFSGSGESRGKAKETLFLSRKLSLRYDD